MTFTLTHFAEVDDGDAAAHNTSILSAFSDEGLDISQHFAESMFAGPDLDVDAEEVITGQGSKVK